MRRIADIKIAVFAVLLPIISACIPAHGQSEVPPHMSTYEGDFGDYPIGQYLSNNWMLPASFLEEVIKAELSHKNRIAVTREVVEEYGLKCGLSTDTMCAYEGSKVYSISGTANNADGKRKIVISVTIDLGKGIDSLHVKKSELSLGGNT